ncbi:GntR family transcriptional regulator [Alkalihalophilus pseudofirmus]|uniref:GntR family transcriptional regulator n=1 Tax=Alkalihalobacterium alkalinitrilicum TaxID=427920 RepID=UPI00094DA797|nr:GntR family transcriptional regulator [Alkalihalobacterium alkalinitrilicum]OLO28089.1 GntR family transcriptional regulator [Alkalihalophilus pseudofirmus]
MTKQTTASIQAYEFIRDKILNGELSSGTKLVEEKLALELGMSRTPIRESIRKLEQEGLIKQKKVITPTESDLRHIFQIRMLLEGFACRCASSYMTEETLQKLENCVSTAKTGSVEETMKANKEFHDLIVQASNNPVMIDIIDRMQSIIYLFRKTVVLHKRPFLIDEHQEIYEAIRAHDGDRAEQLMKQHLQSDWDFCLHLLKQ